MRRRLARAVSEICAPEWIHRAMSLQVRRLALSSIYALRSPEDELEEACAVILAKRRGREGPSLGLVAVAELFGGCCLQEKRVVA